MKGILPVFLCILLMTTTSSTALTRKLAENGGLQAGQVQAEPAINVDGRPSTGYGDHVCPRNLFPNCSKRLDQASSNNHLGWTETCIIILYYILQLIIKKIYIQILSAPPNIFDLLVPLLACDVNVNVMCMYLLYNNNIYSSMYVSSQEKKFLTVS
jgi:hypothetical protein